MDNEQNEIGFSEAAQNLENDCFNILVDALLVSPIIGIYDLAYNPTKGDNRIFFNYQNEGRVVITVSAHFERLPYSDG